MTLDLDRLKFIWAGATVVGVGFGFWAGAFALSRNGLDAGWLVATVIALGLCWYVRAVLLALAGIGGLVWLFARPLLAHFEETEVDREGETVSVTPNWRRSGDDRLDSYLAAFAGPYAVTIKSMVWVLIILAVAAIAWVASLFGLVEFSLW